MEHQRRQTIIAGADIQTAKPLIDAVKIIGAEPAGFARTSHEALALIKSVQPEFLLADLILPGSDGLQLAQDVLALSLNRYPAMLLLDPAGCAPCVPDWLSACGMMILPKPLTGEMLSQALCTLIPEKRALPPQRQKRLFQIADDLGLPDHPGRQYLMDAAALVWMDSFFLSSLKKRLYSAVAQKNSTDAARVERAMRYVIDTAWRTGDIAHQHRIFGDTIDARRGKPTCGEMIARLADILRWEGRE